MLSEKQNKNSVLSVVKKSDVKVVRLKPVKAPARLKKRGGGLLPLLNQFNTGYIKVRKNDPL